MPVQDFAKFVASQQISPHEAKRDWGATRDEWLARLDALYCQILEFLKDFTANGSIECSFSETVLNEEDIGVYSAKTMKIRIGRQNVLLEPIGTMLIGFAGRVDAVGSAGRRAQLVLVNANAKSVFEMIKVKVGDQEGASLSSPSASEPISWTWKIMSNDARRTFVDLDRIHFLNC
jgi:hypothetical protein